MRPPSRRPTSGSRWALPGPMAAREGRGGHGAARLPPRGATWRTVGAAVGEGRIVFGNIKKYLMYLLSCNVGEIVLLGGSVIAGLLLLLIAAQFLCGHTRAA